MKILSIFICLLITVVAAKGQDSTFIFGVKGSFDWTGLAGKNIATFSSGGYYKSLSGTVIGLCASNRLSKYVCLKHELFLARRFVNIKMDDGINSVFTSNIKRQYLAISPASLSFNFRGLQFYAGPYIGLLMNASIQRKDSSGRLYTDKSFSAKNSDVYATKWDGGFKTGLEYEFKQGLNIGLHCTRGIISIIQNGSHENKIFNRFWGVSLGYNFTKTK